MTNTMDGLCNSMIIYDNLCVRWQVKGKNSSFTIGYSHHILPRATTMLLGINNPGLIFSNFENNLGYVGTRSYFTENATVIPCYQYIMLNIRR